MEQEEQRKSKGLWAQMQESWDKKDRGQVPVKPFSLDDWYELWKNMSERDVRHREETKKYWPDISTWPEDLPEGVYQGSICGVRGMYSTKFRNLLREESKKLYEKSINEKESGNTKENHSEEETSN